MKKITVLVADDHTIVRQGLKHLIEMSEDIEVIGEADNGEAVLKEAKRLLPNVILLDIAMPKANGIESARRLAKEVPVAKILMLSTYHDDQEVHLAIAAGATGYLMKETAGEELVLSVKTVEKHRQTLMNKLHVHDAAGLTRYAIARGLVPCDRPSLVRSPEQEAAAVASANP